MRATQGLKTNKLVRVNLSLKPTEDASKVDRIRDRLTDLEGQFRALCNDLDVVTLKSDPYYVVKTSDKHTTFAKGDNQ